MKSEKFEKCKAEEKCFKCSKEGSDVKYKECDSRNKNLKEKVQVNAVNIVSTTYYLDYMNTCLATIDMSEED